MKQMHRLSDAMKASLVFLIALGALIQGACGLDVTVSSGDGGESGSVSMNINAADDAAVDGGITVGGGIITPQISITGPTPLFEQTHEVKDSTGKSASVSVKVVNALDGLTYESYVLPDEGTVTIQPWVSAEQWLTVPKADSIETASSASYGSWSADAGIKESKGSVAGDYVTLTGYYGRAFASDKVVAAEQTATEGSGNSINIFNHATDGIELFSADTKLNSITSEKAKFEGLNSLSSAGGFNQATQNEHIHGAFTGKATYTPATGTPTSKTRTSNYGNEFDLKMQAMEWSLPTGTLGYYVDPSMATLDLGAIQGAVNAAQSGDTINAMTGTYKENVEIGKSLNVKGAGAGNTVIDGQKKGTVLTLNKANTDVTLSGTSITGGYSANYGGGIYNQAGLTITDSTIFGNTAKNGGGIYNGLDGSLNLNGGSVNYNTADQNGGGIYNHGTLNLNSVTLDHNKAVNAGGVYNWGKANVNGGSIKYNTVQYNGGGIYSDGTLNLNSGSIDHNVAMYGGGIFNWGTVNQNGGSISLNEAVKGIDTRQPGIYGGYGGGVFADGINGIYNLNGGSIDDNKAANSGGGMYNSGTVTQNGGSIDHNKADNSGGGIYNDPQGRITLNSGSIDHNIASRQGGGIVNTGMLNLDGASISYNTASVGGGGIHSDGSLYMNSGSVDHNIANMHGGGILGAGPTYLNGGSINNNQATTGLGGGICFDTGSDPVAFNGPNVIVDSNKANLPNVFGSSWYKGYGVYFISGTPTTKGGFNSATQIKSNIGI